MEPLNTQQRRNVLILLGLILIAMLGAIGASYYRWGNSPPSLQQTEPYRSQTTEARIQEAAPDTEKREEGLKGPIENPCTGLHGLQPDEQGGFMTCPTIPTPTLTALEKAFGSCGVLFNDPNPIPTVTGSELKEVQHNGKLRSKLCGDGKLHYFYQEGDQGFEIPLPHGYTDWSQLEHLGYFPSEKGGLYIEFRSKSMQNIRLGFSIRDRVWTIG
jgi:hypothetical protein